MICLSNYLKTISNSINLVGKHLFAYNYRIIFLKNQKYFSNSVDNIFFHVKL